ncbi:MAG: DsrE family protein [Microbacter sp.]
MYHVIFHLDETAKTLLALQNIANLILEFEAEKVVIELLVNGEAVNAFLESEQSLRPTMIGLHKRGVTFVLCAHSLQHVNISPASLVNFATIVPSGVAELVEKQSQGWAYIKP